MEELHWDKPYMCSNTLDQFKSLLENMAQEERHNKWKKNHLLFTQLQDLVHSKTTSAPFNRISFSHEF
jgi:hypothetical protein